MPVNAPTVDGSPPLTRVSFHLIDRSGDKDSVSFETPGDVTDAQIEAVKVALGAATNALVYKVEKAEVYEELANASLATDAVHDSVYDQVIILFKDPANRRSQRAEIPAPLNAITAEADRIVTSNAAYIAYRDAVDAMLGGSWGPVSARYTENREVNDRSTPA